MIAVLVVDVSDGAGAGKKAAQHEGKVLHDAVVDAVARPDLLVVHKTTMGDLDRGLEALGGDGLQDVAVRIGLLRLLQGVVVGIAGDVDDGDFAQLAHLADERDSPGFSL